MMHRHLIRQNLNTIRKSQFRGTIVHGFEHIFTNPIENSRQKPNFYYGLPSIRPQSSLLPSYSLISKRVFHSQRQHPEDDFNQQNQNNESRKRTLLATASTAGLVLWGKTKWVLGALKFTKFMPALSMIASTGAYAFFFGWPFAVGMVGLIGVHEGGHLLAMKMMKIPAGPTVFVPFMGAFISMKDRPKDVYEEAIVALGGPILGSAGALAIGVAGGTLGSPMLAALADFGLMINLFNLLPIGQLDGGRIGGALSPYVLVGGLGVGGAMIYYGMISNPIFYLVMFSGAFSTYDRFFGQGNHSSYYGIPTGKRIGIASIYLILIAALVAAMAWNKQNMKSIRDLRLEAGQDESAPPDSFAHQLENFASEWSDEAEQDAQRLAQHEADFMRQYFGERGNASDR